MTGKHDKRAGEGIDLPFPAPSGLRGKQSVRATFRLSRQAIDALSIAAVHLGLKQKSLFDHLIEDARVLEHIAREVGSDPVDIAVRVQKTFVLSRRSLSILERTCRSFETPRDALVEYSIQRLLPIIEKEKEKHRRRKTLLRKMGKILNDGHGLLKEAEADLGQEDPLTLKLQNALAGLHSATEQIAVFVERCEVMEKI
ncbi:MAG: hypothetical protein JEZ11_13835 [Desulfobacterales bacterium]|nr:hypothetical protein [Desulfobacterales bacterium]